MTVRLKDIAEELGVSLITVSKALRGAGDISEQTRRRVLKRAAELHYRPNMQARALAGGKSYIAGLVVPDLLHPFFAELAKSLNGTLRQHNYALILASSEENPAIEQEEIRAILARGVDALLVASCQRTLEGSYGPEDNETVLVLVDRDLPRLRANFVGTNDFRAGYLATEHLISTGRRRIAHISGPRDLPPAADRRKGYEAALAAAGFKTSKKYVVSISKVEEYGEAAGVEAMRRLLGVRPRPDAVFCYNDLTAIGAMSAVGGAGLAIPEDVAFVGCGNVRYSGYLRVPLTSIDQSTSELGRRAGELALELIRDRSNHDRADHDASHVDRARTLQKIQVEPKLVERASSARGRRSRPGG